MMTLLCLFAFHATMPAAQARYESAESPVPPRSYIRIPIAHSQKPVSVSVHPTLSCMLELSIPFDYIWASDQGPGSGGYYSYQQFGSDRGGEASFQRLLIKPVKESRDIHNLWIQIGDHVLSVLVSQTNDISEADHRVFLDIQLPAAPIKARNPRPPKRTEPDLTPLLRQTRTIHRKYFRATYNLDETMLALSLKGRVKAEVKSIEIVRGKLRGRGFRARFRGYPIRTELTQIGDTTILSWLPQSLGRDNIYVKVTLEGESSGRYYRLNKVRWRIR